MTASEYLDRKHGTAAGAVRAGGPRVELAQASATLPDDARTGGAVMHRAHRSVRGLLVLIDGRAAGCARRGNRTPTATSKPSTSSSAPKRADSSMAFDAAGRADSSRPDAVVGTIDSTRARAPARSVGGAARRERLARATKSTRQIDVLAAQRAAAAAQRDAAKAQQAALEAQHRDRQTRLRAHAAIVRSAGGHRAAARPGRARLSHARTADQGAGRADRGAGAADRGAPRADRRHASPATDGDSNR